MLMSQDCHFLVRLSLLKRTIFFRRLQGCESTHIHNTYPGRGWGEMLTLTFLQTCAERRCWLSLCSLPWGTAMQPPAPAAQGLQAPLGQVQQCKG